MIVRALNLFVLFQLLTLTAFAQDAQDASQHPLKNDPSGIEWAFSLDEAVTKARESGKIVILKPVSFRTLENSDSLSPSSETQRAMSFTDSRVVNLLNRRFVPYYFDMDPRGTLYDEKATKLSKQLYPDMKYMSSMPTPPLVFMTPERKFLGHASNFFTGEELLERLTQMMDDNTSYKLLTSPEKAIGNKVEQGRLLYELRQLDKAMEMIEHEKGTDAAFLRVQIAREQQNWTEMKRSIKMTTTEAHHMGVDVENVLRYWTIGNLEGIKAKCKQITAKNPRYQEAMYYYGLALFHTGFQDKTEELWTAAIESNKNSVWAYRLDLALGLVKLDPTTYLSAQDKIPSLLGRNYLCPNGIDDLAKRD